MSNMYHCFHVWRDLRRVGLRAPSVAGAEPSVVSPSGAEPEVMHQLMGKAQQREESWEKWWKIVQWMEGEKEWKVKMEEEILARV